MTPFSGMKPERIVIVGASLAGATAAGALRELGFDGQIDLVGEESQLPYHRPPLSKEYLRGHDRNHDRFVHPARYYAEQGIELRLGVRATAIDAAQRVLVLEDGEHLPYDRLLVATGGRNRTLAVPGAELAGVFQLRTIQDCDRIRAVAEPGRRAVVVGLGFIGSEVTASLRQMGVAVAALDGRRGPLARVLGEEMADALASIHRERLVELVLEDSVAAFEGAGRVERVRTKKGRLLECDFVVAGVGIEPNAELVASAGGAVADGVLVDEWCRTSLPGVYAAGDVANHLHPLFGRLRVEHWNNGREQARAAARIMLGDRRPYDYVHSFWSDQYEHVIEYVGFARQWDRLVLRGLRESRKLLGFYLVDGVMAAAVGLDRGGDPEDPKADGELKAAAELIRRRVPVDPAALADEGVGLRRLADLAIPRIGKREGARARGPEPGPRLVRGPHDGAGPDVGQGEAGTRHHDNRSGRAPFAAGRRVKWPRVMRRRRRGERQSARHRQDNPEGHRASTHVASELQRSCPRRRASGARAAGTEKDRGSKDLDATIPGRPPSRSPAIEGKRM